jgi:hypothetical protein
MYASHGRVLEHVREAARATGRVWALAFDMAAMPPDKIFESMTNEWKRLVDTGVTADDRYLHEKGLPVLMIWGFYPKQNITPELANRVIDFFKNDPKYKVFLAGGCEWEWRTEATPGWPEFLRRFDLMCPWNVGNYSIDKEGNKYASTHYWKEDIEEARRAGMLYLPVLYPGFSWDNLTRLAPGKSIIERQDGRFFWKQFCAASELGLDMGYVAMFDEVDEGTAVFKVNSSPPTQGHFVGYDQHSAGAGAFCWVQRAAERLVPAPGRRRDENAAGAARVYEGTAAAALNLGSVGRVGPIARPRSPSCHMRHSRLGCGRFWIPL